MGGKGRVDAFERDSKRCELMRERVEGAGAGRVVRVTQGNFLDIDLRSLAFADVSSILLDPTCSGSGMAQRIDHWARKQHDENDESSRILALAEFQKTLIKHALSGPAVKKVVYSTCSVHKVVCGVVAHISLE